MGTNYYLTINKCSHCGRSDTIHVGKQSAGWKFLFHGNDAIRSADTWYELITNNPGGFADEYGYEVEPIDFWQMVNDRADQQSHLEYMAVHHPSVLSDYWKDSNGHEFHYGEFS